MIGKTLSHYRITGKLGAGGMGTVWLAEDTQLGRSVALKLLAAHLASSDSARQRFLDEARAASRLNHTGIATVFEAGEADGQRFIAYEWIEGVPLAQRLESGPLALPDLLKLARGCAEALAHAHGREVLHRDLTAGNVMLRPDGSPVIVDFGLARMRGEARLTSTGTTLGTAPYMAPEQWRAQGGDARTDLWSLGVVLYFAATGRLPFGDDTAQAVMQRVMNDEPVKPRKLRPDLPAEFEQVVLRLLEKDPRDRLASAAKLAEALRAVPGGEAEHPEKPIDEEPIRTRLARWWRKATRRKFAPGHVVALIVIALAIAGGAVLLQQRAGERREPVLALLPLRNLSSDTLETAYVGEGLGSELGARLGQLGGFHLLPWETTSRFGESKEPLARLARDLGADYLLVGHYESDGERISVGLELVDGHSGLQRWSRNFQVAGSELGALQSQIADQLAAQLVPAGMRSRLGPSPEVTPHDPAAYETFLRGANAMHASSSADRALAEPMFRRALELDSTLAQAWVGLGAVLTDRYFRGTEGGLGTLLEGRACFLRAHALDPTSGAALRGIVRSYSETGPTEVALALVDSAGPGVRDAIERDLLRAWACTLCGLPQEGAEACARVLAVDPHNQAAMYFGTVALGWAGRFAESIRMGNAYLREFGEDPDIYGYSGVTLAAMGRYGDARTYLYRAVDLSQETGGAGALMSLAVVLKNGKEWGEARSHFSGAIRNCEAQLANYPDNLRLRCDLASVYAAEGDTTRFDMAWAEIVRQLASEPNAPGGEYAYLPLALAHGGSLGRAFKVVASFPEPDPGFWVLCMREAPDPQAVQGGAITRLLASPEFIALRAKLESGQARLRSRYLWVTGQARS